MNMSDRERERVGMKWKEKNWKQRVFSHTLFVARRRILR